MLTSAALLFRCPFFPCAAWAGGVVGLIIGLIVGIPVGKKLAAKVE